MSDTVKNEAFHQRLALLIGTEEPFRWAKRMDIPGATFARMWNNFDIPKHEHLCRIAQRCNVSLDWLLMGNEQNSSDKEAFSFLSLVGFANCGVAQGWFNESDSLGKILLPSFMAEKDAFAVLCRGHSMVPAGIHNGNVCIVYPNRPVETGKPTLIRTKSFVCEREVVLSTIKLFDSEDEKSISISGWLDPDEDGNQSFFTEKRSKNCITLMAPVGRVLDLSMPEKELFCETALDETVLKQALDILRPLYGQSDSGNFSRAILFLYEKIKNNEVVNLETIRRLTEIIGSNPDV